MEPNPAPASRQRGDIKFTDHILSNTRYIKRCFNDYVYYIDLNEEKVIFTVNKIQTEFLQPTRPRVGLGVNPPNNPFGEKPEKLRARNQLRLMSPKIGAFDIETIAQNGIHQSYLYCFYNGEKSYSFFADKPGDKQPCLDMPKSMLKQKYNAYTFYAHNLSGFYINFIVDALADLESEGYRVSFIKNNDKLINISRPRGIRTSRK